MVVAALVHVLAVSVLPHRPAADASATGIEIVSPYGFQVRFPPGFHHSRQTQDGQTLDIAHRDGTALVSVTALTTDAGLDCDAIAGGQDGEQGAGVIVRAEKFTTAHGISGCLIGGEAPDGSGAIALALLGNDDTVVTVNAMATGQGLASRLARSTADTVQFRSASATRKPARVTAPAIDRRMIGCFEQLDGFRSVSRSVVRCYRDDLTFTEQAAVSVHVPGVSGYSGPTSAGAVGDAVQGTWLLDEGTLWVQYDGHDEYSVPVELWDDGMLVRGTQYWKRVR